MSLGWFEVLQWLLASKQNAVSLDHCWSEAAEGVHGQGWLIAAAWVVWRLACNSLSWLPCLLPPFLTEVESVRRMVGSVSMYRGVA